MNKICKYAIISLALISLTQYTSDTLAQQNSTLVLRSSPVNFKQVLLTMEPLVDVEYQGESIVVLQASEDTLLTTNGTILPFWHAIDVAKHYGYSLNDITTSGMGSQGNPTRFYAVMTKP